MERKLDESEYKVDFMISDKYINFSGELLRLSLLAISGFGAVIILMVKDEYKLKVFEDPAIFTLSLICFVLCSAAALFHRYHATDTMSWYISWLRAEQNKNEERVKKERVGFHKQLKRSRISLIICEIAFGIGVVLFFFGIVCLFG